jgi:hypothetical protein
LRLTFVALDSMQYGYSPFVVKDACGDRHSSVNDSNVKKTFFLTSRFSASRTLALFFPISHTSRKLSSRHTLDTSKEAMLTSILLAVRHAGKVCRGASRTGNDETD